MAATRSLRIQLITPAPPASRAGNRVTALRWAGLLKDLGHRVRISNRLRPGLTDLLVALHARRSASAIATFASKFPESPIVVALTGTDLYHDIGVSSAARRSLECATRLVVLQPEALRAVPARFREKTRVIVQSAVAPGVPQTDRARAVRLRTARTHRTCFQVCVVGHLREVKDPFLMAEASRLLPTESRVRVLHIGAALDPDMAERARREAEANPRYRWVGEWARSRTLRALSMSDLLVLTSRLEGGANVVSEAIAAGVPVLSTRIPGSVGLLGKDYPGYFPVGDAKRLARRVRRTETTAKFHRELRDRIRKLKRLVSPHRERRAWADLLAELCD